MRARSSVLRCFSAASRFAPLSLLVAGVAWAQLQVPQFDLGGVEVDSSAGASLVVGTGEILPVGAVRFSLAGDYANNPYRYYNNGQLEGSIISDRYTVHVVGGFAPVERMELGLDVPIIASQTGGLEVILPGQTEPTRRAFGSPTVSARGSLLSQASGAPFDVAFQLGVKLPLGSGDAFASDGKVGFSPKLMIGRNLDWARTGLELGLHWRPKQQDVNDSGDPTIDDIGTSLLLAGALSTGPQTGLRGEVSGRTYVSTTGKIGGVELLLGARYPVAPNMEIYALAGPGLGQAPGTPAWRVLIGAAFGNGQGITGTPAPGETQPGGLAVPGTTAAQPAPGAETPPTPYPQPQSAPPQEAPPPDGTTTTPQPGPVYVPAPPPPTPEEP